MPPFFSSRVILAVFNINLPMASPNNNNEDPKKHSAPHSLVVRKIPSSFDSPVIHTGQYVVKGVAERISQTRIPEEEHNEPKRNSDRRRLERKSDQATVIMAMPDGFIDLQDKKVKVSYGDKWSLS
mgnify:CR=1 FL=1